MPRGNSYHYQFGPKKDLKADHTFTRTGPPRVAACAVRSLAYKEGIDIPMPQLDMFPSGEEDVEVTLHVFLPENYQAFEKI